MYKDLSIFIDLDWEQFVDAHNEYCNTLNKFVQFAELHRITVYYSLAQIHEISALDVEYITSPANCLSLIFSNALQASTDKCSYLFKVCFSGINTCLLSVENHIPASIREPSKSLIVSILSDSGTQAYLSVESNERYDRICVEYCNSIDQMHRWILDKSPKRKFNYQKHGSVAGTSPHKINKGKPVSPLLCDNREAQVLLDTAIPDIGWNPDRLFNFDTDRGNFIEFFYEGDNPNKQWHGFHIDKKDELHRLPASIIEYFKKQE